jgi:hypothetical protein
LFFFNFLIGFYCPLKVPASVSVPLVVPYGAKGHFGMRIRGYSVSYSFRITKEHQRYQQAQEHRTTPKVPTAHKFNKKINILFKLRFENST